MVGHRAACQALLGVLLCAAASRAADAPAPFVVESLPGATCEGGEAFATQLLRRTNRIRAAKEGEPALLFRVEVLRGPDGPAGRLSVRELDGTRTERAVKGATCEEVVSAMALIAAILVDPNASLDPLAPAAVTAPDRPPPAGTPPPGSPPTKPSSPPATPKPPATITPAGVDPPPGAVVLPRGTSDASVSTSGEDATDRTDGPGAAPAGQAQGSGRFAVGMGVALALEGAPFGTTAAGVAFLGSVAFERDAVLSPLLELSLVRTETVRVDTPSGVGEFRLSALRLLACPVRFPARGSLDVRPCALGEFGTLEGVGKVTDRPERVSARWVALGAAARLAVRLLGPLTLVAEPALVIPLIRHEFYFDPRGPETTALKVAPLGFSTRLGVAAVLE